MFCPHCGKEIAEGQAFCQICGARLADTDSTPSAPARSKTPWEDRETVGFLRGLFSTVREVLFRPSAFFKNMPVTGGLLDPLVYALIVGVFGLMFLYFWDIVLYDSIQNVMMPDMKMAFGNTLLQGRGIIIAAVSMPLLLLLWLFIVSGIQHLFLMLVQGAKAGFEATFRVVCYSITPFLFFVIPYCGSPITMLWLLTLIVVGFKEAHEISGGKAVFSVLLPILFCCGFILMITILFTGLAAFVGGMIPFQK